ncbi:MAG: Gfo/Idh/MocA family oxidoreductase [Candidatus Hydrogenedentes bacterium]|nr:Gfo/Idh/MocA family oxidoreductase [Candidatus Hydrogenedentota bacterium]
MNDETVSVAVIGLGAFGRQTLEALRTCRFAHVTGVADRNPQLAEQAGKDIDVPYYTDNRQLLLGTRPQAVFLGTPPMHASDLLEVCAKSGICVWKEAPLGRNISEAAAMVRRFDEKGLLLAVGTQRRFTETYQRAYALLERIGHVSLARVHYLFNWGPELQWRADKQSAGGGVLLELGYHLIDLLVWMLGLPEEVYGAIACEAPRNDEAYPQPPHDTDDTASAILRYKDDTMAGLSTSRVSGPVSEELGLYGRDGSLTVTSETCTLRNSDGDVLDHLEASSRPLDVFSRQVEAFLHAVRTRQTRSRRYQCSAGENLLNHAVIDAIYLSSQTRQPESPLDQLRIHGLDPNDCLKHCPSTGKQ